MFRDESLGVCAVHDLDGKLVIHSELFGTIDRQKLERALEASIAMDEAFRARGVTALWTWAETDEQYRYNQFMGYRPTGLEIVFDPPYARPVYEFVKEL